jgi:hypothetical protein
MMADDGDMEGGSYLCTWKKEGKGFRIAVKDRPGLEASGATFAEARSRLAERILLELEDGEPVFQYDKPLPAGVLPEEFAVPEILWIGGNDTAVLGNPDELFEGGICKACGNPAGKRNAAVARLSDSPAAKSDGAEARHIGSLFSEAFVKLLGDAGGKGPGFREVDSGPRAKKKLFELAGEPLAETVAVDAFPIQGVQCAKCRRKVFHHMVGHEMLPFLSREALPDPLPSRFLARNRETLMLCMTGEAWRGIQGKAGTFNVVGVPVGIAGKGRVVRDPALPLFKG